MLRIDGRCQEWKQEASSEAIAKNIQMEGGVWSYYWVDTVSFHSSGSPELPQGMKTLLPQQPLAFSQGLPSSFLKVSAAQNTHLPTH